MGSALVFGAGSSSVDSFQRGEFLFGLVKLVIAIAIVPLLVYVLRFRSPNHEEFTAGLTAPLLLPGREPIDLEAPNWLVSRYLIRKDRNGDLQFAVVAVDIDANRIFFQRSFRRRPSKASFFKGRPLLDSYDVDLSEILWAGRISIGDGDRVTEIMTEQGNAILPAHASNYGDMSELLIRISKHTDALGWFRRPWVQQLVWVIASLILVAVILVVCFLLV